MDRKSLTILIVSGALIITAVFGGYLLLRLFGAEKSGPSFNVFFGNKKFDPSALDCTTVFSVRRTSTSSGFGAEREALLSLLEGPSKVEIEKGYFTSINSGVLIQKFEIVDSVAKIDFNDVLEKEVGGSCRVIFIRSQISATLKQFSSVKEVEISIDGRTEDILQP